MTEQEIMSVMYQFHDLGVTGINIYYEGGGDDGYVDSISTTTIKLPKDDNEGAFEEILQCESDGEQRGENHTELFNKLEEFATDKVLNNIEDWWNNEGGYGNLCIMVPSGQYKVYNHIRVTEMEDFYHEGELLEKFK
tara:strand:+ start:577 stop:987 length:411 start_codon:yes stop_codon:yes gene_type:complete